MSLCCLTVCMSMDQLFTTSYVGDPAYARHTSPIEYLVDRFVRPLDEWSTIPIVSCEYRL